MSGHPPMNFYGKYHQSLGGFSTHACGATAGRASSVAGAGSSACEGEMPRRNGGKMVGTWQFFFGTTAGKCWEITSQLQVFSRVRNLETVDSSP